MGLCEKTLAVKDIISAKPTDTVEDVLKTLSEKNLRAVPVLDENGVLKGMFGLKDLLRALLPVSVTMEDGLQRLGFVMGAAPGVAKRLRKLKPVLIEEVMNKDVVVAHPDTATWEALRLLHTHGSPMPLIEEKTGKLLGLITEQSSINGLHKLLDIIEAEEQEAGNAQ